MTDKIERRNRPQRIAWSVLAATVLGLTIASRIRLLGIPLERDEGEYAYAGQLMLQGIAPYKLAYNMKFPGTYAAMMSIFGQTIIGINLRTKSKKNPFVVLLCESRDMRDVLCASNLKIRTKSAKEHLASGAVLPRCPSLAWECDQCRPLIVIFGSLARASAGVWAPIFLISSAE